MIGQALLSRRGTVRRHTQEIRVGAGAYDTVADAIAYCRSLVTLDQQHRVRILVDNDTYNEAFALPQFCDLQGESKAGVIFQYNDGDNIFGDAWQDRPMFITAYSDSLLQNATIHVTESTKLISGLGINNGETLVTGNFDNLIVDCSKAAHALTTPKSTYTFNSVVDYYLSLLVSNCELIAGGNTCVAFGSGAQAFIGSMSFIDTDITGGEQLQQPAPFFSTVNFTEYWGVFFGHSSSKTSLRIQNECNFNRCNIKQYDAPWFNRGMQAFNLEYSYRIGAKSTCIDSNFETVRFDPNNGEHSTPIFVSGYKQSGLKVNPNATFAIHTDGCAFTTNSNFTPYYDIRWYDIGGEDTAPTVTWGGTGTEPVLGLLGGH